VILAVIVASACAPQQEAFVTPSSTSPIETIAEFFTRCPTAKEVAQVNKDFKVSFEYDPTSNIMVCFDKTGSANLTALQKRAYQTIYVMRLLDFSRPLPWTEQTLYEWFTKTIRGIRFVDESKYGYSSCCDPQNTIVIALGKESTILQTDQWIVDGKNDGLMNITLLYAHEARHNEGFPHNCLARPGDDNTLDEMGAWSVEYYLALWIAQYSNRNFLQAPGNNPNSYRQAALDIAQVTRLTRFCRDIFTGPLPTLMP